MFFFTLCVLQNDLNSIEVKIKAIESDLQRNHKTINMIKDAVRDIAKGDMDSLHKLQEALQVCALTATDTQKTVKEKSKQSNVRTAKIL